MERFATISLTKTLQHYSACQRAMIVTFIREVADRIEQGAAGPKEAEFMGFDLPETRP